MIEITRSPHAMALALAAAILFASNKVLAAVAFAILSGPNQLGTANDLFTAGTWLAAVAGGAATLSVGAAIWSTVIRRRWGALWELGGAAAATLVIAAGLLADAATSPGGSLGANIVVAAGLGAWAILLTVKAAQRSLVERVGTGGPGESALWLFAAAGVFLVAIGVGLPNVSVEDQGLALATALLWMVGLVGVSTALALARQRRLIVSRRYVEVASGMWTLVTAYAAAAIVAGTVFGPLPSITGLRAGGSIVATIEVVAFGVLALAAWGRLGDLALLRAGPPPFEAPLRSQCGHPLPADAHFCPQCGAPAYATATPPGLVRVDNEG